jgi:hypothetical protein
MIKRSGEASGGLRVTDACQPRFRVNSLGRSGRPGNGSNLRFGLGDTGTPSARQRPDGFAASVLPASLHAFAWCVMTSVIPRACRRCGRVAAGVNQDRIWPRQRHISYCDRSGTGPKFFSNHRPRSGRAISESQALLGFSATVLPRLPTQGTTGEAVAKPAGAGCEAGLGVAPRRTHLAYRQPRLWQGGGLEWGKTRMSPARRLALMLEADRRNRPRPPVTLATVRYAPDIAPPEDAISGAAATPR